MDGRWTKKGDQVFYGCKGHVKTTENTKLIADYEPSAANEADTPVVPKLVDLLAA